MDKPPSTSSSFRRAPPSGQLPSTSSSPSQRLPSFRDLNNPIQQVLLNKTKAFNKKTYVPNLFLSRNVQPKVNIEESTALTSTRKESSNRETRRGRREQRLLVPVETFVPGTSSSRNTQPVKSRFKVTACNSMHVKSESIDRNVIKKVFNKKLPTKFDRISSASSHDFPTAVPMSRPASTTGSVEKIPLLTEIMRLDQNESPLFILKTPRYIPAVLDDSKNHPKIGVKNEKSGYKCTIHDLPEGQIGKLQILRSGKIRLVLGNCKFWLHRGVKVNFLEELVAVTTNPDTRRGDIISLGAIKERIIVIPDILTKLGS